MSCLCIIKACGGSKRILRKNIKNFLGKPIIAYSISAALEAEIFDEVMVSTDDPEIADISHNYGAEGHSSISPAFILQHHLLRLRNSRMFLLSSNPAVPTRLRPLYSSATLPRERLS